VQQGIKIKIMIINTDVISQLANAMKWDSTPEERLAFANWVLSSEKE
jgi:hypothetical protein